MASDVIRVGLVGAGNNTREKHIPGLQAIEGVEIVSVCNRSRESSAHVAATYHIPTIYDNWRELVDNSDTDAIVIGTWPNLHHPITLAALAAGKHVLCEARMASNAVEAHEMLQAAIARPDLIAQIVPAPVTLRVDKTVKRLIAEGFLGDIVAAEVSVKSGFLDRDRVLHWRQDFDISGVNIMGLGIWYESVMRLIGGARRVMAMGQTFVKTRRDPNTHTLRSVRVPDHLDVIAEMECGAQAHFGFSQVSGFAVKDALTIFGSEGTLRFVDNKLYGGKKADDSLTEIAIPSAEEGGWRVEAEFINAIRGKEQVSHTTFADGVKYMEFTEAVARSMDESRAITLPLR